MDLQSKEPVAVKEACSMQPTSTLPKAEAPRLPCPAHAPGYADHRAVAPVEPAPLPTSVEQQPEAHEADRAFHAMLARLSGGISPVALSLAYIDWASHLAAAPQRRAEIVQDGMCDAGRFFDWCCIIFRRGRSRGR